MCSSRPACWTALERWYHFGAVAARLKFTNRLRLILRQKLAYLPHVICSRRAGILRTCTRELTCDAPSGSWKRRRSRTSGGIWRRRCMRLMKRFARLMLPRLGIERI